MTVFIVSTIFVNNFQTVENSKVFQYVPVTMSV